MNRRIVARPYSPRTSLYLEQQGVHPVLSRIYAARGIATRGDLDTALTSLLPPESLLNNTKAAVLLADALAGGKRMLIVADYDCDGATACTVGLRGLSALIEATGSNARIDYLVPNRFKFGYGLTPEIVALAQQHPRMGRPDLIITVDNGIASIEGVQAAHAAGIEVLITDHHLPGPALPKALIVNPNQPGCEFGSKSIAGVGVMFYVLLALRAELRKRNAFTGKEPNLAVLLDLVALGTVADVVRLDRNNRILVAQGLKRVRDGKASPGVAALFTAAAREPRKASCFDLGFAAGPRLNAAGRLDDMALGIECLLADDRGEALARAQKLDTLNRERRDIEAQMKEEALASLEAIDVGANYTVCLTNSAWHQGVVGIVASRLRERYDRPAIVFAPGEDGDLKGSGRSIAALHMRDCLDLVSKAHPTLIRKFGGHAMAAGLTIAAGDHAAFTEAFEAAARAMLKPADLAAEIVTDGALETAHVNLPLVRAIDAEVWGSGFPAPTFADIFTVSSQRLIKDKHLKVKLEKEGRTFDAIQFNSTEPLPARAKVAFRLGVDEFNGLAREGVYVEAWEAA
jgi:single-stranded-DNA-specific exonuclease